MKPIIIAILATLQIQAAEVVIIDSGDFDGSSPSAYTVPVGKVATLDAHSIVGNNSYIEIKGAKMKLIEGVMVIPSGVYIKAYGSNAETGSLSFAQLTVRDISESIELMPTNTVVIPSDASGTVQIILEQSEDLVTWTAALPGTYGSSTTKRFFRVRALSN